MPHRSAILMCLMVIACILVFAALKLGESIFAPMVLAMVLGVVLSPLSDLLDRVGLPKAVAAFACMAAGLGAIGSLVLLLEPSVTKAVARAPVIWEELRSMIAQAQAMMRGIDDITESVASAVGSEKADGDKSGVEVPSVADAVMLAPRYAAQVMIFVGTLYFFLLARTDIYRWIGQSSGRLDESHLSHAETQVARYFLTISVINAVFGVLVGVVMSALGMPAPVLLGMLAFLVNYILYLGPAVFALTLILTGIIVFDGAYSFLPAALYVGMNATEGQFVTPALVGKSLSVNPLLVFLSLVFWLWLWGPLGGFIAIPLVIWVMVIAKGAFGQTISSGTPGKLSPNLRAGAEA